MKCIACDKVFTGLVCFQQHEASEKHKKKVALTGMGLPDVARSTLINDMPGSSGIYCSTCSVSFTDFRNYEKHVNSIDHADMIKKREGSIVMGKDECTATNELTANNLKSPSCFLIQVFAKCDLCSKQFSGPEPYQQHLASAAHKKKAGIEIQNSLNPVFQDTIDGQLNSPSIKTDVTSTSVMYATCNDCHMQFTGEEPYQLHLSSAAHVKKAGISAAETQISLTNSLRCSVCDKDFSGPIPYQQHMVSIVHKKKLQHVEMMRNFVNGKEIPSTLSDSSTAMQIDQTIVNPQFPINRNWYCSICNKQCTGPAPYNQHIVSEAHCKKVRMTQIEEEMKRNKSFTAEIALGYKESSEDMNDFIPSVEKVNQNPNDFRIENDLIVCHKLESLQITLPEELNITVFDPDEEIVFDSPSKANKRKFNILDFDVDEMS